MIRMTPEQMDVLTEMINIGVGRSAAALSDMVNQEVGISVPSLEAVSRKDVIHRHHPVSARKSSIIEQSFTGSITGKGVLVFSAEKAKSLSQLILPGDFHEDGDANASILKDTLGEVGNIILNHCISGLADVCEEEVSCSPIEYHHEGISPLLESHSNDLILLLQVSLSIETEAIEGELLFILDVTRMSRLIDRINAILDSV